MARQFSDAPTVRQFFAVPGVSIESGSTTPSESPSVPSLPAATTISMFLLLQTNMSRLRESSS